jgi:hypothetical protein
MDMMDMFDIPPPDIPKGPRIVPDSPQEQEQRRQLIQKITQYVKTFPREYYDSLFIPTDLTVLETKELKCLLNDVRYTTSQANSQQWYKSLFDVGTGIVEGVCLEYTPIRAKGFSQRLSMNPEIDNALKELQIEWSSNSYLPPEKRLLYICGTSLISLHSENLALEEHTEKLQNKVVSDDFVNRYSDL